MNNKLDKFILKYGKQGWYLCLQHDPNSGISQEILDQLHEAIAEYAEMNKEIIWKNE